MKFKCSTYVEGAFDKLGGEFRSALAELLFHKKRKVSELFWVDETE